MTTTTPLIGVLLLFLLQISSAREIRTIFIGQGQEKLEQAVLFTGKENIEVKLPGRNFSPEIEIPKGALTLAILPRPLAEGEEVPKAAQKINIREQWSRVILLFLPDPTNKFFPARVIPVNASSDKLPVGHSLFYNFSESTIYGKFGARVITVEPGQSLKMRPPIKESGSYPVQIDCRLPGEETTTALARSSWHHSPDSRQIVFIVPSPQGKFPRLWSLNDSPPRKPPTNTPTP